MWDVGAVGYVSDLHIIDVWSLTDLALLNYQCELTRAKTDREQQESLKARMRDYVMSFSPAYIIQDNIGLLDQPAIRAQYQRRPEQFFYLNWYMCGPLVACQYPREVWVRVVPTN
jgi:hypothetical protein